jgi:hypothetical protein
MYQKTIKAGNITEIIRYQRKPKWPPTRRPRVSETSAKQRLINSRHARRAVARLLNANFEQGDRFVTLTYASDPTPETAQRAVATFIKRLQRHYPKLKYVAKTETNPRIHHHFLLKKSIAYDKLVSIWGAGYVTATTITDDDLSSLANYLTKEEPKPRQWYIRHSQSLTRPTVDIRHVRRPGRIQGKVISERYDNSPFYGQSVYIKLKPLQNNKKTFTN